MGFVWLGRIAAWGLVIFGALRVAMGLWVATAFEDQATFEAATARYIGSGTTGDAIDRGVMMIGAGILFGLLAKIAAEVSYQEEYEDDE